MSFVKYTPKLRGLEEGKRDRKKMTERGREEVGGERRREVLKQNLCGGYFISYFSYYSILSCVF